MGDYATANEWVDKGDRLYSEHDTTSKKAIDSTLQINPGTAAAHTRNIMQKLNCSSWEHIRDFIEQSGQADFIQQHLKRVLAKDHFDLLLHQLADQLIGTAKPMCLIVCEAAESEMLLPIVHKIEEVLKRIGIAVQLTIAQNMFSIPSTSNVQIIRLSQQRIGADVITIADYPTSEALMVKVLESVVGEGVLKELKASFDGYVPLTSETCSDRASLSFFSHLMQRLRLSQFVPKMKRLHPFGVIAVAISFLGVIGVAFWGVMSFAAPKLIRSDLTLPPAQVCLQRSNLVDTIQRQLKSQEASSIPNACRAWWGLEDHGCTHGWKTAHRQCGMGTHCRLSVDA